MRDFLCQYKNKIVAITGASGYLASALIGVLRQVSAKILRVSRRELPPVFGMETLKADISSRNCWNEIVDRADVIFHFAGNVSVYAAAKSPADSLNSTVLPLTLLAEAAQEAKRFPRVVFASTATIYGLTDSSPVSEDTLPAPITNYDLHKLFAEKQLDLISRQGILDGLSLRLANVYGPSPSNSSSEDRGVLNKIALLVLKGANLQLYGGGECLRDYIYIDDVVQAFLAAGIIKGGAIEGRSFNVASGKGVPIKEVFSLVAKKGEDITGKHICVESVPWPKGYDPIETRNFTADIASFCKASDWVPTISLSEGVDRMLTTFYGREK